MSEGIENLRRMLSQAQKFATETPLEAVSRIKEVQREATELLATARGDEREDLDSILALAKSRREHYEALLAQWDKVVRERADQFVANEQDRIGHPIPPKV